MTSFNMPQKATTTSEGWNAALKTLMPIIAFGLPHKEVFGLRAVWKGLPVIAVTYNHSRNERENDICLESSMRIVQTSNAIIQDSEGTSCSGAQLHSRDCFMAHGQQACCYYRGIMEAIGLLRGKPHEASTFG